MSRRAVWFQRDAESLLVVTMTGNVKGADGAVRHRLSAPHRPRLAICNCQEYAVTVTNIQHPDRLVIELREQLRTIAKAKHLNFSSEIYFAKVRKNDPDPFWLIVDQRDRCIASFITTGNG